jgi:hypothetical protein
VSFVFLEAAIKYTSFPLRLSDIPIALIGYAASSVLTNYFCALLVDAASINMPNTLVLVVFQWKEPRKALFYRSGMKYIIHPTHRSFILV